MNLLFWLCVGLVGYVYIGYPTLLWLLTHFYQRPVHQADITPKVTLAIAAFNEQEVIARRIENCLVLDYPSDCLEIIIASDGSTDRTADIVRGFARHGVRLLDLSRRGKALSDNALVEAATGEIVVTSSADGRFPSDFLRRLVRSFADSEVGAVTGVFRASNPNASSTSANEGAYWRYEMGLRHLECQLGILAITAGVCLGFRRELYKPLSPSSDADNMVPLHTVAAGKRVIFEPEAVAYDEAIVSPQQQLRNRIRQVTKSQRDTFRVPQVLNPLRHFGPACSLWSHKLLRWWTPFFAIGALIANLFLLHHPLYRLAFLLQALFYVAAAAGYLLERQGRAPRVLAWPANLCLIHLAFLIGTLNVLRGKQIQVWEPQAVEAEPS